MVAVLIFGLGGGISAYEGVLHMLHPPPLRDPTWSYIVLGVAAAADIEHDIRSSDARIKRIYIEARAIREATRPPGQPDTA